MPTFRVRVVKSMVYKVEASSPDGARALVERAVVGRPPPGPPSSEA